jgi:hypothetical protein
MGSRYLTDLADVIRAAGLAVIEEPGWQSRARGSGGYSTRSPVRRDGAPHRLRCELDGPAGRRLHVLPG